MSEVKWKKLKYGRGIYTYNPDGDMITIEPSDDHKGMWTSGGRYSSRLGDLKAEITQSLQDGGSGYRYGGEVVNRSSVRGSGSAVRGTKFKGVF